MYKRLAIICFILLFPLSVAGQVLPFGDSVRERAEALRERETPQVTSEVVRERAREHFSEEVGERMAELTEGVNNLHRNRMRGYLRSLEAMGTPLDRLEEMIDRTEERLEVSLDKTRERLQEAREEIEEVLDELEESYEAEYEPEEGLDLVEGMRESMRRMSDDHRVLQERVREARQGVRDVMLTFREEIEEAM